MSTGGVPPVAIRDAVEHDVEELRTIFRDASLTNEGDRPLFAQHPEFLHWSGDSVAQGRTVVAEVDVPAGRRLAGFASTAPGRVAGALELEDLFVDPALMRRGVARALIAALVERARASGVSRLEVDANDHALAFYEQVGFVVEGTSALDHGTAWRMALAVVPG